jgi:hypothetical protein
MDNEMNKESLKSNPDVPAELEIENGPDATGYWFAAAVLFTVLAAGIIIYRTGTSDMVVARNDTPAAHSAPIAPPPFVR